MDWLSDLLDPIDAGTWPDWVAAIFTSAAFLIAALSFRRSVNDRTREEARRVYVVPTFTATEKKPGQEFDFDGDLYWEGDGLEPFDNAYGGRTWRTLLPGALHNLVIRNDSTEVVTQLRVSMDNPHRRVYRSPAPMYEFLAPGAEQRLSIYVHRGKGKPWAYLRVRPALEFRDAAGRFWTHGLGLPLTRRKGKRQWLPHKIGPLKIRRVVSLRSQR